MQRGILQRGTDGAQQLKPSGWLAGPPGRGMGKQTGIRNASQGAPAVNTTAVPLANSTRDMDATLRAAVTVGKQANAVAWRHHVARLALTPSQSE